MKIMIRSFASALVAVMTLGLVHTAQAEIFYIGDPVVHPEKACEVKGCPSEAEEASRVEFTLSNFAQGVQLDSVKVVPTYWYEPFEASYDYDKECFYFDMPNDNVYIEVYCSAAPEPGTDYSITIPEFKGGSVTSDVPSAQEGAPVTLTVTPDKGYELASIVVVGDGVTIDPEKGEGSTYTFTMPPSAVEVQATFKEKLYKINIPEFKGGTVTSNVASTNEGATVTLTVTPDAGYELDTIKVDGIDPEKGEGSTYTFEMPASDVEVQATFKAAATKHTISTVADPEGTCLFTVYPSEMEAPAGTIVEFRFDLADGANFVSLDVYNTDNPSQSVGYEEFWWNGQQWYRFTMPDYNVTIKVTTQGGEAPATAHKISSDVTPSEACEVHAQESAQFGEEVYFEVGNFAAGATLGSLTVWNMSAGEQVKCEQTGKGYIFTMPDGDVLIEVVCSDPAPTTKYSITTEVDPANACVITPSKTEAEGADVVTFTLSEFMSGQEIDYVVVRSLDGSAEFQPKYNEEMNEYWFNMPYYDVMIFVHCTSFAPDPGSGHKISTDVQPSGACEVHAQESAQFGEEVYFEVGNFAAGATLGSLTVWNMSAGEQVKCEQTGKGYIFTMPDGDVLIEVVCSDPAPTKYKISTSVEPEGACEFGQLPESAQSGTDVYFELNFAAGAELVDLTVSNTSAGEKVKCEPYEKGYIFTMPAGEVLIAVSCSDPEPPTLVEVMPLARSYTSEIGAYTNGVLLTATPESTYIVNSNATVDVVFEANTSKGRYFKVNGVYTSIVTNTITASTDPYPFLGPLPDTGKKVGDSAYAFVDGGTCTIVGSGTADTRLATVVSPGAITSVVIQPGITEIGARFFKGFKWLNAVTGGQDLATVGTNAFYACFSLVTIDLDCTAVPTGMDGAVVYQTALKSDGSTYQIPEISVKNHVKMLFGKKSLNDADWTCLGPSEGRSIYEQGGYQFFQIRLVPDTGSKE